MRASLQSGWGPSAPGHDPFAPRVPLPLGAAVSLSPPFPEESEEGDLAAPTEADAWRRVRLGDDVELLIRAAAYERRRDLVEWLIAWAWKVFR